MRLRLKVCGRILMVTWFIDAPSRMSARTFSGTGALKNMEPEASLSGVYRLF
jgi:hypothetical protein